MTTPQHHSPAADQQHLNRRPQQEQEQGEVRAGRVSRTASDDTISDLLQGVDGDTTSIVAAAAVYATAIRRIEHFASVVGDPYDRLARIARVCDAVAVIDERSARGHAGPGRAEPGA